MFSMRKLGFVSPLGFCHLYAVNQCNGEHEKFRSKI